MAEKNLHSFEGILLDIEGTTSSIHFVYDVMFPFVRQHLADFLQWNWSTESLQSCIDLLAVDVGFTCGQEWLGNPAEEQQQALVEQAVNRLMDEDAKVTGLKELQGLVWKSGFESGTLVSHLFDDVVECIRHWNEAGIDVRIYSSGSIAAQKLFFRYSIAGDLTPFLKGFYDTTVGPKRSRDSYRKIAVDFGLPPEQILFVSDVLAELQAAQEARMHCALSVRPGNPPVSESHDFPVISSFREIG